MDELSRRSKALLLLGYVAFTAAFMGLAAWQHWTVMTQGPKPMGVVVAAGLYWAPVTMALRFRESPRKGGPGTTQVDRPERGPSEARDDAPPRDGS